MTTATAVREPEGPIILGPNTSNALMTALNLFLLTFCSPDYRLPLSLPGACLGTVWMLPPSNSSSASPTASL